MNDDFALEQAQVDKALTNNTKSDQNTLRKIKFVEYELNDMAADNLYTAGLYQLHFEEKTKSNIEISYPQKYSFDPAIFQRIIQESHSGPKYGVVGLLNHGSSCYISSAIQALLHLPSFVSLIQNEEYKKILGSNSLLSALNDLINQYQRECKVKRVITPEKFFPAIKILGFSPYKQADAGELVYRLLEQLASSELRRTGFQSCEIQEGVFSHLDRDTSAIDQLFYQVHVQFIECQECGFVKTSQTTSRSMLIPMAKTLRRGIASFEQKQEIEGYECSNCRKRVKIKKFSRVVEVGELFMIQLQRWDGFGGKSGRSCRLNLWLDLSEGIKPEKIHDATSTGQLGGIEESRGATHNLAVVLCHQGRPDDGHYYAFIKSGRQWWICNDEHVAPVPQQQVASGADWTLAIYAKIHTQQQVSLLQPMWSQNAENIFQDNNLVNRNVNLRKNNKEQALKCQETNESLNSNEADLIITGDEVRKQYQISKKVILAQPSINKTKLFNADEELLDLCPRTSEHRPGGLLSHKSDILHVGAQNDEPRRRKTQQIRDENRRQRAIEVQQNRDFKTRQWKEKQIKHIRNKYNKK